jgi:hypothetical protein
MHLSKERISICDARNPYFTIPRRVPRIPAHIYAECDVMSFLVKSPRVNQGFSSTRSDNIAILLLAPSAASS